jgi:uncharacterized protein (DUF305 family)
MHGHPYLRLLAMAALSFLAMYILMYAMVNSFANVLPNLNQAYMAGLMTAPMVIIELLVMRPMYERRSWNIAILVVSVVGLLACWFAIRDQVAIADREFLKSMIPHHAGAILMCEEATIQSPEIKKLCREIIQGQQAEIEQMKALLNKAGG